MLKIVAVSSQRLNLNSLGQVERVVVQKFLGENVSFHDGSQGIMCL